MKMKKIALMLLLVISIIFLNPATYVFVEAADLDLVYDMSGVLTEAEIKSLTKKADKLAADYEVDVAILILDDIDGNDAYKYAKIVFNEYDYGQKESKDGILFMLATSGRKYALIAHGYANKVLTDYGRENILDKYILPKLAQDKYKEAFDLYYERIEVYLEMAEDGKPFDTRTDPILVAKNKRKAFRYKLAATFIVPIVIASLICVAWRKQMKTAVLATSADNYIPQDGFNLTGQSDVFLYRTQTSRTIKSESSGSGGTSVDSDGFSGSSGNY